MKSDLQQKQKAIPQNKDAIGDGNHDLIMRYLDCAVIEFMHSKIQEEIKSETSKFGFSQYKHFDTVRGVFTEGGEAFEGAGIQKKTHIQICIRNLNCIKGFFMPRSMTKFP